ncbi:MAG: VOC family protein [Burkholderiaceae bacterium]
MIDHLKLPVSDIERSARFYEAVPAGLGRPLLMRDGDAIGFGEITSEFGIDQSAKEVIPIHLAFIAKSQKAVRRFYSAAVQSCGRDNGEIRCLTIRTGAYQ